MGIPQWIMIILIAIPFFKGILNHGQSRTETENFWSTSIGLGVVVWILIWGGFFG